MIFYSIREKFIFYNIPILLFSLIPFFLILGPFLTDLSISLISIIFLIYSIKRNNFSYFKKNYFYFFLLFWAYLIFNSLINNFNLESFKISFFYFRYGVFVVAIASMLEVNDKFIKYFFYCIFLCFLSLVFDGFYQYFNKENILGWKASIRISSFFGDEKILGSYLSRLWPIFFGLSIFFLNKKNIFFKLFVLIFILSEALIFLSGERTAFFYINISALFIIFLSKKLFKLRLYTLISSILLLIIISFINPSAKERVLDQSFDQMNIKINTETKKNKKKEEKEEKDQIYIFSKQHTHHYITAYKMFLDNKILGVGVKNFRKFCNFEKYKQSELSCSTHPHNTYIQILSETGLIGFTFLLFVFIIFWKYVFKHLLLRFSKKYYFSDFEICILSGILIYIWPIVPTGNIFNNWLNIMMILNLPFLIWSKNSLKRIN